jgi:putative transposase
LRSHLSARLRLSDPERSTLAEIGRRPSDSGLARVACVAQPETILAWYRLLIARKFDGSQPRSYRGRPPIDDKTAALVLRMARENSGWGYDRIVGVLANLGHRVSDQTVANVLRRYGIAPAPKWRQKATLTLRVRLFKCVCRQVSQPPWLCHNFAFREGSLAAVSSTSIVCR